MAIQFDSTTRKYYACCRGNFKANRYLSPATWLLRVDRLADILIVIPSSEVLDHMVLTMLTCGFIDFHQFSKIE